MTQKYLPEGMLYRTSENTEYISGLKGLEKAMQQDRIVEAIALSCNSRLDLTVSLGEGIRGILPKSEVSLGTPDKKEKDIATISRVGKAICFKVVAIKKDGEGRLYALLSRRQAQAECVKNYLSYLVPGQIVPARVTHTEPFGAFVDIGCGMVSLLSIDCISVSRISHPKDRLTPGSYIRTVIKSVDRSTGRIYVSHKELLGTWEENAALYEVGQTVTGTVRSIEDYGIFVELTPNLAGLAECKEGASVGCRAAVFIKSIIPERMKIKLVFIDSYRDFSQPAPPTYFISEEQTYMDRWVYSPAGSSKCIETVFAEK